MKLVINKKNYNIINFVIKNCNHKKLINKFLNINMCITGFFMYKNIVGCCIIITTTSYKIVTI
jgi:hypothetical protein